MRAGLLMWLNSKVILTVIFLIALTLRVYAINQTPPGLTWDEASLGYNAYSLLKTGKDEYGEILPLIFKSFGDYKPALYSYLAIPFVGALGLNEFAVRLPSIILGSLIPILGYFLTKKLTGNIRISLILSFLLAISPWTIHYSRGAWEANVAFFELLLGTFILLKAQNKKSILLSAFIFGLAILTYQSAKLFSLIYFLVIIFFRKNELLTGGLKKWSLISLACLLIILVLSMANPEVRSRLTFLNQLNYPRKAEEITQIKNEESKNSEINFILFHSEKLEYLKTISGRYLTYFSPKFLFITGSPDGRQGLEDYGVMHLFEIPFLILGLICLKNLKFNNNFKKIFIALLLFSPIPAILSRDNINLVRSLPLVFFLEFITAIGIFYSFYIFKRLRYLLFTIITFSVLISMAFYLDNLLIHSKINSSDLWLHSNKEMALYVEENKNKYNKIYISTEFNEPYIFYLFYTKYDPSEFQKQAKLVITNPPDVGEVGKIDNLEFGWVDLHKNRFLKNILMVGSDKELTKYEINSKDQIRFVKSINNLDGTVSYKIIEVI